MIARRSILGLLALLPTRVAMADHASVATFDKLSDLRRQRDALADRLDRAPSGSYRARRWRRDLAQLNVAIVRLLPVAVCLVACKTADPGISKERAMAVLQGYGYQNITIGPTPKGWEGMADVGPNTYTMKVTVDPKGLLAVEPAPTH